MLYPIQFLFFLLQFPSKEVCGCARKSEPIWILHSKYRRSNQCYLGQVQTFIKFLDIGSFIPISWRHINCLTMQRMALLRKVPKKWQDFLRYYFFVYITAEKKFQSSFDFLILNYISRKIPSKKILWCVQCPTYLKY